jgi:hypothetical protein
MLFDLSTLTCFPSYVLFSPKRDAHLSILAPWHRFGTGAMLALQHGLQLNAQSPPTGQSFCALLSCLHWRINVTRIYWQHFMHIRPLCSARYPSGAAGTC